ncbi:MAG: hypothetical protein AAGC53_03745 [Actinomycetota bacterium]
MIVQMSPIDTPLLSARSVEFATDRSMPGPAAGSAFGPFGDTSAVATPAAPKTTTAAVETILDRASD